MENWNTRMFVTVLMASFILSGGLSARSAPPLSVTPTPASGRLGDGWLSIGPSFHFSVKGREDSRVAHAIARLMKNLSSRTGIPVRNTADKDGSNFVISYSSPGRHVQTVDEDESYRLAVTPTD